MTRRIASAVGLLSLALGGCATGQDKLTAYRENRPTIDPAQVGAYVAGQNAVYNHLLAIAPVKKTGAVEDHSPVVAAGIAYVDLRCARYMDALFWLNRAKNSGNRQLGYLGSASAAILEILDASSALVALAPIGFKFLTETVDNVGKGLLYDISPAAVRSIVEEQQAAFKKAIANQTYTSKASALLVVQEYASLCLPASIEGKVEKVVASATFKERAPEPTGKTVGEEKPAGPPAPQSVEGGPATAATAASTPSTISPPPPAPASSDKIPVLELSTGE